MSEEREALSNERLVLSSTRDLAQIVRLADQLSNYAAPVQRHSPSASPQAGRFVAPAAAAARPAPAAPRAALSERDLGPSIEPAAPSALTAGQVRQLKEEIYRDLLSRVRTEFERGM